MTQEQKQTIKHAINDLTQLADELQAEYDNKSDTWQDSDAGVAASDTIDSLLSAIDSLEECQS